MKTVLITGGTDGVGKGLALKLLPEARVIVVGTSLEKANQLKEEAKKIEREQYLHFIQADLSVVAENHRVIEEVKKMTNTLDQAIFCAASLKPQTTYQETKDGIEFTFALYYMSRYLLSYGLKDLLEQAEHPMILNVAAPGMKGKVNWDDLQYKTKYNGQAVQFHGSRLNDLLGVHFVETDQVKKIGYMLFNPMAVRTSGAEKMFEGSGLGKKLGRLYYKLLGKDVEEIVAMIFSNIEKTSSGLYAFKQNAEVSLTMSTFDRNDAAKLDEMTKEILR